ncbi:MAG: putative glycolipid-binding domain-containing protein [Solirubrobacterales bacterium]
MYFRPVPDGWSIDGVTTAVEDGHTWVVGYAIETDADLMTRRVQVRGRSVAGTRTLELSHDGQGRWVVDGRPDDRLDGCRDVDLESSAMTNALPIRRLGLEVGGRATSPAAYVRAESLAVERLEQEYMRVVDHESGPQYDYAAPAFHVSCRLLYDTRGLVAEYPGLAHRMASAEETVQWS